MIVKYLRKPIMSILSPILILIAPGAEAAGSLAGSEGHVRFPAYSAPGSTGGCSKDYRDYIAARGHSAYAMTPFSWATEFTICGASLNASSQQVAEEKALKSCEAGRKKWKVSTAGACGIAASK